MCWSLIHSLPVSSRLGFPCGVGTKACCVLSLYWEWQRPACLAQQPLGEGWAEPVSPLGRAGSWGGNAGIPRAGSRAAQPELEFPSLLHWGQKFIVNNFVIDIIKYISIFNSFYCIYSVNVKNLMHTILIDINVSTKPDLLCSNAF